ncbi:glycosyltransferase family 39 protein [Ralstonia solanacearum]|uniref:Glycosyltransferase family 39 protein n=1 Tax=Ralstonia solanacearum TaxID=305 RepID=A0AAW5ZM17_RALSL|nr:glycosyltransferase family 39 protein [Ralstonia solanacearum]MDB0570722.1 glycosyltransferase family 39 protein [Ralstonia solanacearum]
MDARFASSGRPARRSSWMALLVVALIAVFAALWTDDLFQRSTLFRPDEGRYAEIPREMVVTGDWITPRLNDLKYFEKPPLQYWTTAATFQAFGVQAWGARLWPLLFGLGGIAITAWTLAAYRGRRTAAAGAAILASSLLYLLFGQVITLDMGVGFFLTVGACGFALAQRPGASRGAQLGWMLTVWLALAGATLTKGLIGVVLPGLIGVAYLLMTRDWALLRRMRWLPGLALYLLATVPWFVLVQRRNPEFFDFFFIHEHFQRFLTTEHHRAGKWWYFIAVGAAGLLPWTPLLLTAIGRRIGRVADLFAGAREFDLMRWSIAWAAMIFLFFSASSSKLPGYIVPAFPALAICLALALERLPTRAMAWALGVNLLIAVGLWFAVPVIGAKAGAKMPAEQIAQAMPVLREVLAMLAIGTLAALLALRWQRRALAVIVLALSALFCWDRALNASEIFRDTLSARDVIDQTLRTAGPIPDETPFYSVENLDQTAIYYLGRPMTLVSGFDELEMGAGLEPDKVIATTDDWIRRWTDGPPAYAFMRRATWQKLTQAGVPMRVVAEAADKVVVARH